jgi:probable phosphoglycerate mutase
MKKIWFIRHAESLSNAGFPTDTPHAIGLSEKGMAQAEAVAAQWQTEPDLIVVSRYSRTAYTAVPLCRLHPQVQVVELPVHELTFLAPGRYIGTTETTRREPARQYWERCDPDYCDGEGAESFCDFCKRIDESLEALRDRTEQRIAVFCHAYVIKAILWRQLHPDTLVTAEYMRGFFDFHLNCVVPNIMVYPFESAQGEALKMLSPFQIEIVG